MEDIDFSEFKTPTSVVTELARRKDNVCNKVKEINKLKGQKKDMNKSFNETIKSLDVEVEFEMEVIEKLKIRMRELESEIRIMS